MLKPRLKVRRPGVPEVEIPIDKREFIIGRLASQVDLVLDDELVSRRHASLTANERGYFRLEDLGSQNGIKFEGRPVRRLNLLDGDEILVHGTGVSTPDSDGDGLINYQEINPPSFTPTP